MSFNLHNSLGHNLLKSLIEKKKKKKGISPRGAVEKNPIRNHEVVGSIPGLTQGVKDPVLPWAVV